jgi:hypothetical protein
MLSHSSHDPAMTSLQGKFIIYFQETQHENKSPVLWILDQNYPKRFTGAGSTICSGFSPG